MVWRTERLHVKKCPGAALKLKGAGGAQSTNTFVNESLLSFLTTCAAMPAAMQHALLLLQPGHCARLLPFAVGYATQGTAAVKDASPSGG